MYYIGVILIMAYEVEYTDEFEEWWNQLNEDEQATVDAYVKMLEQ